MLKKISIGLLVFLLLSWIAASLVDSKYYGSFIARKLEKFASQNNIQLYIRELDWRGVSFKGTNITISTLMNQRIPVSLNIDHLQYKIKLPPLLIGQLHSTFNLQLYKGNIIGAAEISLLSGTTNIKVDANNLNIAEHALIAGFGINSADLSFKLEELELGSAKNHINNLRLTLSNLNTAGDITLEPKLTGLPLPLKIAEIKNLDFNLIVNSNMQTTSLSSIKSQSNLGILSGGLTDCSKGKFRQIYCQSGQIQAQLTDYGQANYGSMLSIASFGQLKSSVKQFKVIAHPENWSFK